MKHIHTLNALRLRDGPRLSGLLLAAMVLGATSAGAGTIVGSKHDLSAKGYTGGEICVVCHTPHAADTSVAEAPLWNHTVTSQSFTMYSSLTLDAVQDTQPTGVSKLCLSCHDGTVAIDSFGGASGNDFMNPDARVTVGAGGNLSDDHPISITYDTNLATNIDTGLYDPNATNVTIGAGGDKTKTGTITAMMLSDNKVQCTSCHDVHNSYVAANNGDPLLKVTIGDSALCLTCHNK